MAQRVQVMLVCDLHGDETPASQTLEFALDGAAYEIDLYAAVIRGCYEGWDTWLGGSYHSGDLWGCLGRWFSGQWYSTDANSYISRVQNFYNTKPWLTWKG